MRKEDVKGMADLARYAIGRLAGSVRRNDPIAAAYWSTTWQFALENVHWSFDVELLKDPAREAVRLAGSFWNEGKFMDAALFYSKAKWLVTIGRNLGFRMPPRETGINLDWLRTLAARKPGCRPDFVEVR